MQQEKFPVSYGISCAVVDIHMVSHSVSPARYLNFSGVVREIPSVVRGVREIPIVVREIPAWSWCSRRNSQCHRSNS